jgi:hypothetical protein
MRGVLGLFRRTGADYGNATRLDNPGIAVLLIGVYTLRY